MARPFDHIPDELKQAAQEPAPKKSTGKETKPEPEKAQFTAQHRHKRPFQKTRAGVPLTKDEVKEIRQGRKALRKELRSRGIKDKTTFELYAGEQGLYFDKRRGGFLLWLLHGRGLWAALGLAAAALLLFFLVSSVAKLRGFFTINMSDEMFKDGFVLSETPDFALPSTQLSSEPAVDVPCISIAEIAKDVNDIDGPHNTNYFAYTFYIRNEGDNTVDYVWDLELTDESKNLSKATWVMVFEDGAMEFSAKASSSGGPEALPAFDDNTRGYLDPPLRQFVRDPEQYQVIAQRGGLTYYRLVPSPFVAADIVQQGGQQSVAPGDVHKYCVVVWVEGDDPDCTDELKDGHLGLAFQFRLVDEERDTGPGWLDSMTQFFKKED